MASAQDEIEGRDTTRKPSGMPPAGPHARRDLTDKDKTPGTGALPDDKARNREADVGSE